MIRCIRLLQTYARIGSIMKTDDYEDITPVAAKRAVKQAKEGDRDAALRLLDLFAYAVKKGDIPDSSILSYLADCFELILAADDPNNVVLEALHLKREKHRERDQGLNERDEALALAISDRIKTGESLDEAITSIANEYPKFSEDVIRHAWRRLKNSPLIENQDPIPD